MDDEFFATLDALSVAVFVIERNADNEPIYLTANKKIRSRLKLSIEEIAGKTAAEIYKGRFGDIAYKNHCQCLLSGQAMTYELSVPFGDIVQKVETTLVPLLNKEGEVYRIVGTSTDQTAAVSIREAAANTQTLNKEMEQFISLSAHDLRSPMRNMHSLTTLLQKDFRDLGDGKLEIIKMLEKVSESAIAVIGSIIDYTLSANTIESTSEFELEILCRELFTLLDPAGIHKTEIKNCHIVGDKVATEIVLRNLIDNAIKHNADKVLKLKISARELEHQRFEISLIDDGCGMADPSKLFSPATPSRINSGFGLRAVNRLVKARGGKITASSAPKGRGLCVKFTLPGQLSYKNA